MDDLLQSHIKDIFELHMPEGLKELTNDIAREVLRAQPTDIYSFIADYLAALLVTRDNMTIASQICTSVCECNCQPELLKELMNVGLSETDAQTAQEAIFECFKKKKVHEGNLLAILARKTDINDSMFPAIIDAIRAAYLGHQAHNFYKQETSSESEEDEVAAAAAHTLKLYQQCKPLEEEYSEMSDKIEHSYRAYGVRRGYKPRPDHFGMAEVKILSSDSTFSSDVKREMELTASMNDKRISTESSFSLAGSMCRLPKHVPYNAHDDNSLVELEENCEKEHAHIDYTVRSPHVSIVHEKKVFLSTKPKRISFQNDSEEELHHAEKHSEEHDIVVYHPPDDISDNFNYLEDISETLEDETDTFEDVVEEDVVEENVVEEHVVEEHVVEEHVVEEHDDEKPKSEFHYVNAINEDVDESDDEGDPI